MENWDMSLLLVWEQDVCVSYHLYLGLGYIDFVTWHLVMMRLTGKTWSGGGRRQREGVKNPTDVLIST